MGLPFSDEYQRVKDTVVYYNRRAVRAAKRAKMDRLLSELFGQENVRSIRIAFDPFSDFTLNGSPVIKPNRTRKSTSGQRPRESKSETRTTFTRADVFFTAGSGWDVVYYPSEVTNNPSNWTSKPVQVALDSFTHDTTVQSRPFGAKLGEFIKKRHKIYSTNRSNVWTYVNQFVAITHTPTGKFRWSHTVRDRLSYWRGPSGRITKTVVDNYYAAEQAYANFMLAKHGFRLASEARPNRRSFSVIREIGELKDLPQTIRSTVQGISDLVGRRGIDIPSSYLNKEFGWGPVFNSVFDLVKLPDIITKRVNYLLQRNGRETTFRSSFRGIDGLDSPAGFSYDLMTGESRADVTTSAVREYELRCVCNYGIRFPMLELPQLKRELLARLWGARFRPSDVYDLIPWSWLTDWFFGLGDYIDLIGAIYEDESIVNWGLITYSSKVRVSTILRYELDQVKTVSFPSWETREDIAIKRNHTSILEVDYQERRDLSSSEAVKSTWYLENDFSAYQSSILFALLGRERRNGR